MKKTVILFSLIVLLSYPIPTQAAGKVLINEFVAHPSSGNKEWVEFYNPDHVDLSTYWIDDDDSFQSDTGTGTKKSLANLNNDNPDYPYIETSSFFNNNGDKLVLFDAQGHIIDEYEYLKDPGIDVSIGRSPNGSGDFFTLAASTKGSANSDPLPTNTPTPVPTSPPTSTPQPTRNPTPTNVPTPTKITIKKDSVISQITTQDKLLNQEISQTATISSASSTPTKSQTAKDSPKPSKENNPQLLIKGMQIKPNLALVTILLGISLLCISCGILILVTGRKNG